MAHFFKISALMPEDFDGSSDFRAYTSNSEMSISLVFDSGVNSSRTGGIWKELLVKME